MKDTSDELWYYEPGSGYGDAIWAEFVYGLEENGCPSLGQVIAIEDNPYNSYESREYPHATRIGDCSYWAGAEFYSGIEERPEHFRYIYAIMGFQGQSTCRVTPYMWGSSDSQEEYGYTCAVTVMHEHQDDVPQLQTTPQITPADLPGAPAEQFEIQQP